MAELDTLLTIVKTETGWIIVSGDEEPDPVKWSAALTAMNLDPAQSPSAFDYFIEDRLHCWEIFE